MDAMLSLSNQLAEPMDSDRSVRSLLVHQLPVGIHVEEMVLHRTRPEEFAGYKRRVAKDFLFF